MLDLSLKNTIWVSVLLNILLGILVFYCTSKESRALHLPSLHPPKKSTASFKNATENFLQFPIDLDNATAVFNSVNGVVKEKDSNMNPVGVNFFPAYIPPNTLMYHSRNDPNIPELFEWVAMDYEFSYSFASFTRGKSRAPPKRPKTPGDTEPKKPWFPWGWSLRKDPPETVNENEFMSRDNKQTEMRSDHGKPYLFTFKNKQPLDKLIFLDGASAAKSTTGEMDQQMILSQQEEVDAPVYEREAAGKICKWGEPFGLQGVVRLEVGFEIILCDFNRDLDLVSNVTLYNVTNLAGFPYEGPKPVTDLEKSRTDLIDRWESMSGFEWMRSGGNVNDGDERILIDYSNMVTPLNKTWIDADPYQRRINTIPKEIKSQILSELEATLSRGVDPYHKTNWGQIIGHITDKFSPMLVDFNNTLTIFEHLADANVNLALKKASEDLSRSTFNFIRRYSDELNPDKESQRSQALQWAIEDYAHNTYKIETPLDRLIYSSVYRVVKEVVLTVFELYDVSMEILPDFYLTPSEAQHTRHREILLAKNQKLKSLLKTLGWSVFTKCSRVCSWDEVCAVPGWGPGPMGWSFGNKVSLHYENGSYRVNQQLECVKLKA